MALSIPLDPIPNQTFSVLIEGNEYDINLQDLGTTETMAVSMSINQTVIFSSFLVQPFFGIIPYEHLNVLNGGNFVFETKGDNYPYYEDFAITTFLFYLTESEYFEFLAAQS